ncbi:hypothetical protein HT665_01080 [Ursidibacter maritimus]|uniref:Uncharacterized protein n=1 Tax=Ursidibacter maritimus TaxID=1331689 RepID=A0A949T0C7_9PAST|nr:hypothetical protein [Ursidibacter maritimus]KAE9540353.1 hypothetical protein A1D26_01325 [Ursidibacter maritimus]MBV6523524.1 hypothetical protein [Ursidibacter maritimus]MBV6525279.1 hypothetical protein [Ursidibacter maritimus]MBV6528052.1 hypothetical protein [Ursidibacter maritimus]MBV6529090.1 hypothetical protein [Ursidibacter maritimus]
MNKTLALALGLLSTTVFAEDKIQQASPEKAVEPKLTLTIYDTSNTVPRAIEGLKYSLKAKNLSLCWTAFDMPFIQSNKVIELFHSPKASKFTDASASTVSSKDKKQHTIENYLPSVNGQYIHRCWNFDKKDPLGKYSVEVQINNIKFPALSFEVVK